MTVIARQFALRLPACSRLSSHAPLFVGADLSAGVAQFMIIDAEVGCRVFATGRRESRSFVFPRPFTA